MTLSLAQGFHFSEEVRRGMAQRNPVTTGVELLNMNRGFRALWVDEQKRPFSTQTPNGVKDATDDPRILWEWSHGVPDSGLAIVLPDGIACIDQDDLRVSVEGIPNGTWGERTRRGEHHLVSLPIPLLARQRLPREAGDMLCGPNSYVVIAPSADRWPIEINAPILPIDLQSDLWNSLLGRSIQQANPQLETTPLRPTRRHEIAAADLLSKLMVGTYSATVKLIVGGCWVERYPSRSEADFALAFMASHFIDDPRVIAALVQRFSEKARQHRNSAQYLAVTVQNALIARDDINRLRLVSLLTLLTKPNSLSTDVYDATCYLGGNGSGVIESVVTFAGITRPDDYSRNNGWRRIPIQDLATIHGVSRQTVRRAILAAEAKGLVERECIAYRHDGATRRDTLVRPAGLREGSEEPGGTE